MIATRLERKWLKRWFGLGLFAALLALILFYRSPVTMAQAPTGYVKIASVTTLTYTDTTGLTAGEVNDYVVTATNAAGESLPSNAVVATTPNNTNPHSNVLSWTAPATGSVPTGYNVYRLLVTVPNAPTGLGVVSN